MAYPVNPARGSAESWPATLVERASASDADTRIGFKAHLPFLAALFLLSLLAGLPLLQFKLLRGHDALYLARRMIEFDEGLRSGDLVPRWAADFYVGYGEPVCNFIPPVFYYVGAFFRALGTGVVGSMDLAFFTLLVLAGFGMYLLAQEFFGRRGGLVAATALLFSPYVLTNLYVRSAAPDFSAFAFVPLAFWGLHRFVAGGCAASLTAGSLGLAPLLLSSNSVAVGAVPTLLLFLFCVAGVQRRAAAFLRGSWCLALGLGLSAFFTLPAAAERGFVHLDRVLVHNFHGYFASPEQLIGVAPGAADGVTFALGPVQLLSAVASLVLLPRVRRASRQTAQVVAYLLLLVLLAAFMTTRASLFIWDHLQILHYLSFPWRFLSLAAVGAAFLCGTPFVLRPRRRFLADGLLVLLNLGLCLTGLSGARPSAFRDESELASSPEAIAAGAARSSFDDEYEPVWVMERPQAPPPEPVTLLAGTGRVEPVRLSPSRREFRTELAESARLLVHTFYFPGWTVRVDGAEQPIDVSDRLGAIEFTVDRGTHEIVVSFEDTPVRVWSKAASAAALILLLVSAFCFRRANPGMG